MSQQMILVDADQLNTLLRKVDKIMDILSTQKLEDMFQAVLEPKNAAEYLKISGRYLQALKDKKEIPFTQYDKIVRYKLSDLDAWMNKNRVGRKE